MNKNLAIFLLALVAVLLLAAAAAGYKQFSAQLESARAQGIDANGRAATLEAELAAVRVRLKAAEGRNDELTALRNLNTDLQNQLAETKVRRAPIDDPAPRFGGGFNGGREIARAYADMIARNDAKLAELAKDAAAVLRLRKLDDLPEDQRKVELAKMQQAGDAITIDNETIPLGTPGLEDKLRRLMLEQGFRGGSGRRYGGGGAGRRYEPQKEPETNNDKF